jgi:hypothetical protein
MAKNSPNTAWRKLNARQKQMYAKKTAEKRYSDSEND